MTTQCKQCSKTFVLEPRDLEFYKKISVPVPTLCPTCRFQRRLAWRNERILYTDTCDSCHKKMFSLYSPDKKFTVYCHDCFWNDKFNPLQYGQSIDWSRPFFEQFAELLQRVPRINLLGSSTVVNSEYTNDVLRIKDSYLVFNAGDVDRCLYSSSSERIKDLVDCDFNSENVELCYETTFSKQSYNLRYADNCRNCHDGAFLRDCRGCSSCFMCIGLINKSYCYKNQQLTQQEYQMIIQKYDLAKRSTIRAYEKEFEEFALKVPRKYYHGFANEDSYGDYIDHNKSTRYSFQTRGCEHCAYCFDIFTSKDCYDYTMWGEQAELVYECVCVGRQSSRILFSSNIYEGRENFYCESLLNGSQNCFGCISFKKDQYCILNQRYSEKEFFQLRTRLIEHMKTTGEWGEFFPVQHSPFAYNESEANEFYPLSRNQVLTNGWQWQDQLPGTFGKETIGEVPDAIAEVPESIIKEVIACVRCHKNFRYIQAELDYYKRQGIPLPNDCPNCRYSQRMQRRPIYHFWQRQCMCTQIDHDHPSTGSGQVAGQCTTEFDTSYSPDRKEIVYCEKCYQKEIY